MLFSTNEKLEDAVIRLINHEPKTAKAILKTLISEGNKYTIQSVYGVLRELINDEVVIKNGFYYKINEEWKNKIIKHLSSVHYEELTDGEKTIFLLNSLSNYDIQWKNSILPLHHLYPEDPIFFYNYHYIWIHLGEAREQSELDYYKSFLDQKRYAFSLVGSHSALEVETKKMIENDYVRVFIDDKPIQSTGYITIINDYIITTYLPTKTLDEVSIGYKKSKTVAELNNYLQDLDFRSGKLKIIIERNKDKAKKLRKKMSKDFHIPKELREKFDLF